MVKWFLFIVVYKPDNDVVNSPDLLLQQLVPKSYLILQRAIKEKVTEQGKFPFQRKDEFLYDMPKMFFGIIIIIFLTVIVFCH